MIRYCSNPNNSIRFLITHKVRLDDALIQTTLQERFFINNPSGDNKRGILLNNLIWIYENNNKTSLFIIEENISIYNRGNPLP